MIIEAIGLDLDALEAALAQYIEDGGAYQDPGFDVDCAECAMNAWKQASRIRAAEAMLTRIRKHKG